VRRLLLATNNRAKLRELRRLLAPIEPQLVTPADLGLSLAPDEPHQTYAENAEAKARAFCRAADLPTLADDSGLEVAALGGGPGVRTGRYGGAEVRDPVSYLLERLARETDRRARMVCWLALAVPTGGEPDVELFSGTMDGEIATEPRGTGGFGYDPVFLLPSGLTTAQLPDAEKDAISHRGGAVAAALPRLRSVLAD
jgi:XTP/dITP diphosphohydrolase